MHKTPGNLMFNVGSAGNDATHFRIYDAASGGDLIWMDGLTGNPDPLTANQFYRGAGRNDRAHVPGLGPMA